MATKYSRYPVSLALLSVALPLMTGSLKSAQKQSPGNYGPSESAASIPAAEREVKSKEIASPKAGTGLAVPGFETILARMSQAAIRNETRLSSYTVTREYEMFGRDRNHARSRVVANIVFSPPKSRKYHIEQTEGSVIGEEIVRRVLKREAVILREGQSTDISQGNYRFRFLREEAVNGRRCYVLQMLPRREDKNLLRGTIWVDATTYRIHRVEGQPEENPSWWVRKVHIVLIFGDVSGMWLPTSSEYTAKVRILGPSAMVAHDLRYSYPQFAGSGNGLIEKPPISQEIGASFSSQGKEIH
ncbi:MAG TPA: hypothetical protein VFZ27_18815 [Terriglobia bacterium]|nr:hypothetical protein [Terriglobia bacterium]